MEEIKKRKLFIEFLNIFWICTCVGAQMLGSGVAVAPILRSEFVEKRNWITDEELLDFMSIAKCTPGAYTVNIVAFIGNKRCGILGGVASSIGVTIIPIITMILFTMFYEVISEVEVIRNAIVGITVCVCALIINSLIDFWKKAIIGTSTLVIFIISFLLHTFTNISIIVIILVMGLANYIFEKYIVPKFKKKRKMEV